MKTAGIVASTVIVLGVIAVTVIFFALHVLDQMTAGG